MKGSKRKGQSFHGLWYGSCRNCTMNNNDISINNIMFHWKSKGGLKIGVCDRGCVSHMSENVGSLWHAESKMSRKI